MADESLVDGQAKLSYEQMVLNINKIASPLAPKKTAKKIYKIIKKAQKLKNLRKGVREVQKFIRKGERGLVIIAGDISPLDVASHIPVICEEGNIPYCYTPSKEDLGAACGSKRATCLVMVKTHPDYEDAYNECFNELKAMPIPM